MKKIRKLKSYPMRYEQPKIPKMVLVARKKRGRLPNILDLKYFEKTGSVLSTIDEVRTHKEDR